MQTSEVVLWGVGEDSPSGTALGVLAILALGIGGFAYATSRLSHRRPGASSDRPWAKKGVFRGLGRAAIQLWGLGRSSRRRRRRR